MIGVAFLEVQHQVVLFPVVYLKFLFIFQILHADHSSLARLIWL